jgi:phosphotriesterase-related protein
VAIQTVLGPIEPDALGITLPHEHLLTSLAPRFIAPPDEAGRRLAREPVTLENLSWVRRNYLSNVDNMTLGPESLAIEEVARFRAAGGGTIVDASSIGLRGDLAAIARISRATGVHVVVATGYYTYDFHDPSMATASPEGLADVIVRELLDGIDGIDGTGVRAGIVGEVGCNWPLHPDERKSVIAAGMAQAATGAPVSIHPGRSPRSPFEILEILASAGADLGRVVMGHIERTEFSRDDLLALAGTGVYLEYDWFGETLSMHPTGPVNVPSDTERIEQIQLLFSRGHGNQVLASHDVCLKTRLAAYGGMGYAHIPTNVAGWMRAKGMADAEVTAVLVDNPRRVLAGV